VLAIQPLLDIFFDPKAVSIELAINDSKGQPLVQHEVVIRPTLMNLQNNQLAVQRTDAKGHVKVQLRTGEYTAVALNGETLSEARFEITTTRGQCPRSAPTCIFASPRPSHPMKPVVLQLLPPT
jgi:hypothetical protein